MFKIKVRIEEMVEEMVDDSFLRVRNVDMILDDEALAKIANAIASQQSFAPDGFTAEQIAQIRRIARDVAFEGGD